MTDHKAEAEEMIEDMGGLAAWNAIENRRALELAQCDALVDAVRAFIKDHIEEHGPNVRYSDALSIVALSLMGSHRRK